MNAILARIADVLMRPSETGQASRAPLMSWKEVILFHLLLGIMQYFALRYGVFLNPQFNFMIEEFALQMDEQAANFMRETIIQIVNSPIQLSIFAGITSLISGVVLWIVGRNFHPLAHLEVQSGYLRFQFIRRSVALFFALIGYLLLSLPALGALFGFFSSVLSVWFLVAYVLYIRGLFALKSTLSALLLVVLAFIASLGAIYFIGLFLLPILFLG